jgi:hypothetical protein
MNLDCWCAQLIFKHSVAEPYNYDAAPAPGQENCAVPTPTPFPIWLVRIVQNSKMYWFSWGSGSCSTARKKMRFLAAPDTQHIPLTENEHVCQCTCVKIKIDNTWNLPCYVSYSKDGFKNPHIQSTVHEHLFTVNQQRKTKSVAESAV